MTANPALLALHQRYYAGGLPANLREVVLEETGIDLGANYAHLPLKNPLIVASGQMSMTVQHAQRTFSGGFGGFILKSFVGENSACHVSQPYFRKPPEWIKNFYEEDDAGQTRPIIHWSGRGDTRSLSEYLPFAHEALTLSRATPETASIASIICHFPATDEPWDEEEWAHTTRAIREIGYTIFEIDFCPYLKSEDQTKNKETVLRWYREAPRLMRAGAADIKIYPKVLNLEWGDDFVQEIADAALQGGSDGLVVANRIYVDKYKSGHGGELLRQANLRHLRTLKQRNFPLPVSATGGIYTGGHVAEYIAAGAESTQLLSFIMGKVKVRMSGSPNKFEQVAFHLVLHPEHGLVAELLRLRARHGISSVRELRERALSEVGA